MTSNLISRIGAIRVTPSRFFLRSTTKALRDYFGFFLRFTPKALCGCWLVVAAVLLALTSCSDDLDVQQPIPSPSRLCHSVTRLPKARPLNYASR